MTIGRRSRDAPAPPPSPAPAPDLHAKPARPGPPLRFTGPQLTPAVRAFLANEAGGGAVLLLATLAALLWSNSPWASSYFTFWNTPTSVRVGDAGIALDLRHVVNDAAMAVFFLVLALEINRELTSGDLRNRRTVLVPVLGAVGGMLVPIGIYLLVNHHGEAAHGWGVVMSSDTAFLLGALALFGPRCPDQLRLFLLTLAVVDDIGAITVLASYYTNTLHATAVAMTLVLLAFLVALRWLGVWRLLPYVLVGLALWLAVYKSGVHPTLAGVLVGLVIPARPVREEHVWRLGVYGRALIEEPSAKRARLAILAATATVPPNERLQRVLHPWSAYLVVPAFGIANAGVQLSGGVVRNAVSSPITIGIVVALVVGKLVGITLGSTLALRTHLGELPGLVRYSHLVGGATLAGMGFTISLFVTDIAFSTQTLRDEARIGILAGSLSAALLGTWILRVMGERSPLCSPASALTPPALPPLPWTATADA